jgi:glycosyltransferase involved in cell wall biosynthesis
MLVSVIIPCFKDSATLGRAIDSVLAQSYSPIEIIVVNDCSPETDLIEKCLAQYSQVRYLRNPINMGLAATRNNGIAIADGKFIALLDADDEYRPQKIRLQIAALEPNTVITCGIANVYSDGSIRENHGRARIIESTNWLLYRNTLNGAGLFASKELLIKLGGFDSTLRSCEDFDLWLRLISSGVRIKDIGHPLYLYYFNQRGLSKNFQNISYWDIEVIQRHADRMGAKWKTQYKYATIISVWLLRHLIRSELIKDVDLRKRTIEKLKLLEFFPITRFIFKIFFRSWVVRLFAMILRKIGKY